MGNICQVPQRRLLEKGPRQSIPYLFSSVLVPCRLQRHRSESSTISLRGKMSSSIPEFWHFRLFGGKERDSFEIYCSAKCRLPGLNFSSGLPCSTGENLKQKNACCAPNFFHEILVFALSFGLWLIPPAASQHSFSQFYFLRVNREVVDLGCLK